MNLKDAITDWKIQHGEEKTAKSGSTYHKIPQIGRKELLIVLVETLREKGLDSRLKFDKRTCQIIAEACVWVDGPDRGRTKKKIAAILGNDLPYALSEVFRDSEKNVKISDVSEEAPVPAEAVFSESEMKTVHPTPAPAPVEPSSDEEEDPGMTEHALKLMKKPFQAPKDGPKGLDNDLNLQLLAEIGIDPKEFGWTNE